MTLLATAGNYNYHIDKPPLLFFSLYWIFDINLNINKTIYKKPSASYSFILISPSRISQDFFLIFAA